MSELIYQKAENYDQLFKSSPQSISFWLGQAKIFGGKVLELACGTGRIAIPLALDGNDVTGIDISAEMLEIARKKSQSVGISAKWIHADMRDFSLKEKFDCIILAGNSLCHLLTIEDFEKCMACVKNHLAEDGKFIIDVFTPGLKILSRDPDERFPFSEYQDAVSGEKVVVTASAHYNSATQINHVKTHYRYTISLKEETGSLTMRMYFPKELLALVKYNGFTVENRFGNYDMSPFDENSAKQILILKASSSF
ncbi:MAG: class I SAM-dependent methyltransferase [Bacteroidota bacterium]